jgi:hypothetical protein
MRGDKALAGLLAESKQLRIGLAFDEETAAHALIGKAVWV